MTTNDSRKSEIPNQRSLTRSLRGRCAMPQGAQRRRCSALGVAVGVALCGAAWAAELGNVAPEFSAAGRVVEDRALDFRLADLPPAAKPLLWDEAVGVAFAEVFPSDVVEVRIRIPDEKGIEHPLCLANRGRDADGAYVL